MNHLLSCYNEKAHFWDNKLFQLTSAFCSKQARAFAYCDPGEILWRFWMYSFPPLNYHCHVWVGMLQKKRESPGVSFICSFFPFQTLQASLSLRSGVLGLCPFTSLPSLYLYYSKTCSCYLMIITSLRPHAQCEVSVLSSSIRMIVKELCRGKLNPHHCFFFFLYKLCQNL